jgi:hypothetical protein
MKKVILVAAVGMMALASCKKDYTCDCTLDGSDDLSVALNGYKKGDAQDACDAAETTWSIFNAKCELK